MKKITLFVSLMLLSISSVFSQEITEGKEFWFGLPHCKMKQNENIRGDTPIMVWFASRVNTKVTMTIPETKFVRNYSIRANQVTKVAIDDRLMCRESEVITNNGIHLLADDPISVTVYYSYCWTGEAFHVLPLEALGKEYVTLNMYLEQIDELKPPQILIVATEDNTEVIYTPTNPTEKLDAGQSDTIAMMKGQTFLILGEMNSDLVQNRDSDITGTYIKANKPIAVFSGHTKGAFPRYNAINKSANDSTYVIYASNMLIEQMAPFNMLGTEYISVPIKYLDRQRGLSGVADDFGDLIRFVATADSTIIYQMRQDGSGLMQLSIVLNRGDYYDITNQELSAYYKSNKPVVVGQYGKAWWNEPQNPHKCGQGMLITITPINRWINYANFNSPPAIDNYICLTFKEVEKENIFYDGEPIDSLWETEIRTISGTPYAYITTQIQPREHYLEGKNGAKFAGYAYGNWDRAKDGFAYGYPLGMNFTDDCNDSLFVVDNAICGMVDGVVKAVDLSVDTTCAGIYSVIFRDSKSNNCRWMSDMDFQIGDTTYNFSIDIVNPFNSSVAVIDIISKSGKFLQKEYKYFPEIIGFENTYLDFGVLAPEETKCLNLVIKNNGAVDLTVYEFKLKGNRTEFKINTELPFTLEPNEEKVIEICASYTELDESKIRDSLIAVLECYEKTIAGLQFITNEPVVFIEDADWGIVPVGVEIPKNVMIRNESYVEVEINSISWSDLTHFTRVEGLNLPLTISPNSTYQFTVYYKPDVPFVQHTDTAFFTSNAIQTKLYSVWNGMGTVTPKLIKPSKDTTNIAIEVDFEWEALANTGYYRLQISKESNFQLPLITETSPKHNYSYTFEKNTKYYWRVCAGDGDNFGAWSEVWTFTTGNFSDVKNNIKTNNSFSIFPNPADNELYIEFSNEFSNNCEIEIIDMQGITVSSIKKSNLIYGTNKEQISLKELPFGTYFCILEIGGNRYSKMFVKI